MSQLSNSRRRRLISSLLLLFLTLAVFFPVSTLHAQTGIAMGGTFSDQEFELPQGATISNPGVYVVVFNHGAEEMNIRMSSTAPFGVEVSFSKSEFSLPAGGEQKVYIIVKATDDAVPGEYEVTVSAQVVPKEGEGVQIATASAQKASLIVTGESASIHARVVTPDGNPIEAQVRLSKVIQDKINEIALSENGTLEAKVSPGIYRVSAFIGSRQLAEETVEVSSGEKKEVTLTVRPVYFEFFGIEPNVAQDTERLTFIRVVYTLNNLSEPMANGEIILRVNLDGKPLEQVSLISLGRLDMGKTEGEYRYVPAKGWVKGNYGLMLELRIEGELYTSTSEEELGVTAEGTLTAPVLPEAGLPSLLGLGIVWWGAIGVAVIIAVVVVVFEFRRRRRKLAEKPPVEEVPRVAPRIATEEIAREVAPPPSTAPPAATRNLLIKSYDGKLKRGETCNVRLTFEYRGPRLTGTIRVAIGKIGASGFDEKAYVSKQVVAPETVSWKTYFINVSIPTGALSKGTYDLYARAYGALPEIISPYLRSVITIEE